MKRSAIRVTLALVSFNALFAAVFALQLVQAAKLIN
jgi:hypothetical protein